MQNRQILEEEVKLGRRRKCVTVYTPATATLINNYSNGPFFICSY